MSRLQNQNQQVKEDTFEARLEALLNANQKSNPNTRFEVINCGLSGYGTHQERLFYELWGVKYKPDLVMLMTVYNDDMSYLDEVHKQYTDRPLGRFESLFHTWRTLQDYRHRRPFPDYKKSIADMHALKEEAEKNSAKFTIIVFRNDADYAGVTARGKMWNHLDAAIRESFSDTPVMDVSKALFEKYSETDLQVYPGVDDHPNEIVHRIAAEEIHRFLQQQRLL